eukprot:2730368-Pyramimonas_sp.AAC.1
MDQDGKNVYFCAGPFYLEAGDYKEAAEEIVTKQKPHSRPEGGLLHLDSRSVVGAEALWGVFA